MKHIVNTTSFILTAALCLGACSSAPAQETTSATSATTTEPTTETTTETTALVSAYDKPAMTISPEALDTLRPYEGEWHRTNIHSGYEGTLNISEMDETGFNFSGVFSRFDFSGEITDYRAYFISENEAEYKNGDDTDSASTVYYFFTFENDGIKIRFDGFNGDLHIGPGIFASGEYTKGEPVYTNMNIVEETFTEEDLEALKELLGDGYEEPFISDTKTGDMFPGIGVLTDGTKCRSFRCRIPGPTDTGYDLLIKDDGKIYYKRVGGTLITNDADYEGDELPEHSNI